MTWELEDREADLVIQCLSIAALEYDRIATLMTEPRLREQFRKKAVEACRLERALMEAL